MQNAQYGLANVDRMVYGFGVRESQHPYAMCCQKSCALGVILC